MNQTISIRVGYDWGSNEPNTTAQKRWSFIQDLISAAIVELNKRQQMLKKAPLNVRLAIWIVAVALFHNPILFWIVLSAGSVVLMGTGSGKDA